MFSTSYVVLLGGWSLSRRRYSHVVSSGVRNGFSVVCAWRCFFQLVPYHEIVRVETLALHPEDKPEDTPQITGFGSGTEKSAPKPVDGRVPEFAT